MPLSDSKLDLELLNAPFQWKSVSLKNGEISDSFWSLVTYIRLRNGSVAVNIESGHLLQRSAGVPHFDLLAGWTPRAPHLWTWELSGPVSLPPTRGFVIIIDISKLHIIVPPFCYLGYFTLGHSHLTTADRPLLYSKSIGVWLIIRLGEMDTRSHYLDSKRRRSRPNGISIERQPTTPLLWSVNSWMAIVLRCDDPMVNGYLMTRTIRSRMVNL